jgi:hypothetical protein
MILTGEMIVAKLFSWSGGRLSLQKLEKTALHGTEWLQDLSL